MAIALAQLLTPVVADVPGDHDLPIVVTHDALATRQLDQHRGHQPILDDQTQPGRETAASSPEQARANGASGRRAADQHWLLSVPSLIVGFKRSARGESGRASDRLDDAAQAEVDG